MLLLVIIERIVIPNFECLTKNKYLSAIRWWFGYIHVRNFFSDQTMLVKLFLWLK